VWLLEHPQTPYQPCVGVLAGVLAFALAVETDEPSSPTNLSRSASDQCEPGEEEDRAGDGERHDHADCFCLLEALLVAMRGLLFADGAPMADVLRAWCEQPWPRSARFFAHAHAL